jgi:PAS domain S-box-containing protein
MRGPIKHVKNSSVRKIVQHPPELKKHIGKNHKQPLSVEPDGFPDQGDSHLRYGEYTADHTQELSCNSAMTMDDHGHYYYDPSVVSALTSLSEKDDLIGQLRKENEQLRRNGETLRYELAEYRAIVDHLHVGIYLINPQLKVLNVNRQMYRWHPQMDVKTKPLCYQAFRNPQQQEPCVGCPMLMTLRDGWVHEAVLPYHDNSGRTRNYRMITSPVYNEDGKIVGGVNILRDISEQVRTQKVLQESESLYRSIFELSEAPAAVIMADGTLSMVNRAFEEFTGYLKWKTEGRQNWSTLFDPVEFVPVEKFRQERMSDATGAVKTCETHLFGKSQEVRNVLISMMHIPETTLILAFFSDITQRHTGSIALMESEMHFREMVQNANSIIYRRTPAGIITFINRYAQQYFGYTEEEIIGKNVVGTIVPERDTNGRNLAQMIEDITSYPERYVTNENENMLRSGKRVWVAWTNKVIYDEYGQAKEVLCVGNDVTEQRTMELALQQNEKELRYKSLVLEETNTAMKVLLEQMKKEKKELEITLTQNVRDLLSPYVHRLRKSGLRDMQTKIVEEIEVTLNQIVSPFVRSMNANCHYAKLTPTEIQIANLVRGGRSTKEISDILNTSIRSVDFHRDNIRKKLDLNKKKLNLRSFLMSLD